MLNRAFTLVDRGTHIPTKSRISSARRVCALVVLALIGAGSGTLAGCASIGDSLLPDPVEGAAPMTEPMLVDVSIQAGNVTIVGDSSLSFPEVLTRPERLTSRATRSAQITKTQQGRQLRVVIVTGRGEGALRPNFVPEQPAEVNDLFIRVPRLAGVRVRSGTGNVTIEGVAGSVDVQAGVGPTDAATAATTIAGGATSPTSLNLGGNVRVVATDLMGLPLSVVTPRGDVLVRLPASSAGRVVLESTEGQVRMLGGTVKSTGVSAATKLWTGTVNDGAQPITIKSGRGRVELEFVE